MATANSGNWELKYPEIAVESHVNVTVERSAVWYNTRTGQYETEIVKYKTVFDSAAVTFTWSGPFQGAGEISYALVFGDKEDFSGKRNVVYYPPAGKIVQGDETISVTLDQDALSPVSLVASVGHGTANEIYWSVVAGIWQDGVFIPQEESQSESFYFVDEFDKPIWSGAAPAKASADVELGRSPQGTAQVCNGKLNLTVTSVKSGFGIAQYEVTLKNKTTGKTFRFDIDYNSGSIQSSGDTNTFTQAIDLKDEDFFGEDYEGNYTVSVKTSDGCGHSATSEAVNFVVDGVAPDKVENVKLLSSVSSVLVSWDASYDVSGIQSYIIKERRAGTSAWEDILTVKGNVTSAFGYDLPDGDYEVIVVAEDKSGNLSAYSDIQRVTVAKGDDYEDTYNFAKWKKFGTDSSFSAENTIGWGDLADYFCFECDLSCSVTVDLLTLEPEFEEDFGSKGIKIELYQYDGTGWERAIKSISVSTEKTIISDLLLDRGTYFVKVSANNVAAVDRYVLDFERKNFSYSEYNTDRDNDWRKLEAQGYSPVSAGDTVVDWVGFGDAIDYRKLDVAASGNYKITLTTPGDPSALTIYQLDNGSLKKLRTFATSGKDGFNAATMLLDKRNEYYISVSPAGNDSNYKVDFTCLHAYDGAKVSNEDDDWKTLDTTKFKTINMDNPSDQDWVGFSDTIDYRQVKVDFAGRYNLRLSGISHKVVFTVYQQNGNKLQKLTSMTLTPQDGKTATGKIGNILLESQNYGAVYYVSISAPDGNLEKNSDYSLFLSANEIFNRAIIEDDDWRTLDKSKYLISTDTPVPADPSDIEWIGLGDKIDYRKIELSASGSYNFKISQVGAPVVLTVYQEVAGELVKIASKTVTSYEDTLADVVLNFDHRDAAAYSYYLSVECQKYDGDHNSDYRLEMTGPKFDAARCEDDWPDLAVNGDQSVNFGSFGTVKSDDIGKQLVRQDDVTGEAGMAVNWVGYGDAVDYVQFSLTCAAKLVFDLEASGNADLTVYSLEEGKRGYSLTSLGAAGKELYLQQGTYYIAVKAQDKSVNADIDYSVKVRSGEFFLKSAVGNTDDSWQKAEQNQQPWEVFESGTDQVTDWVGFGNGADYWNIQLKNDGWLEVFVDDATLDACNSGKISFELRSGDEGKKLALNWDAANGCFISKDDFATGNICYLGVVCNDVKKYEVDYKFSLAVKTLQNQ